MQAMTPGVPDQPETVAADAVHMWVYDSDGGGGRDSGVESIAATGEDGPPGLGSESVRGGHEAAVRPRLEPARGRGHPRIIPREMPASRAGAARRERDIFRSGSGR